MNEIKNTLKATRIYRTIPSLLLILLGCIISNNFEFSIFLLAITLIIIYSAGGIKNAINDNDYKIKNKYIPILLITFSLLISILNKEVFVANILWISLGYIYNKQARKKILLDTTIMCITHYFLPIFFTLIILKISYIESFTYSFIFYLIFWLMTPTKNLKEIEKDKKLKYKTITTEFKNGKNITYILLYISLIPIILLKFILGLNNVYLFFIPSMLLFIKISILLFKKNKIKKGLALMRIAASIMLIIIILIK